jgi:hypothetical protein
MTQNYGGIRWDSVNRIYEISGGDIKVANTIHFKNTLRSFNGNYNSLHNKPVLGIGYKYNNDTNVNTIGTGEFKFNNSTILSATQFSIHLSDINSNSNKTFLETFNESTNTNNKGILYLHEEDNYRNSVIFTIENMQSAPEEQLHRIFDIKRLIVKGNGLTDGLNYNITFSPTGNSGLNGSQGAAGSQGSRGNNGNNGDNGSQGTTGAQGSTGTTGSQGTTGAQGERGIGNNGDNGDSTDFTNLNSILGGPAPKTDNIYTSKKSNYVGSVKVMYMLDNQSV